MVSGVSEFEKCCRLCLSMVGVKYSVFDCCLTDMLKELLPISFSRNDGYPQHICKRCIIKVSSYSNFYHTAVKSHAKLTEILKASNENIPDIKEGKLIINNLGFGKSIEIGTSITNNQNFASDLTGISDLQITYQTQVDTSLQIEPFGAEIQSTEEGKFSIKVQSPRVADDDGLSSCDDDNINVTHSRDLTEKTSRTNLEVEESIREEQCRVVAPRGSRARAPCLCTICGKKFKWRTSLYKHARVHKDNATFPCPVCDKHFAEASYLKIHLISHSDNPSPFSCGVCGARFTQRASLNVHVQRSHRHTAETSKGSEKLYRCKKCDEVFKVQGQYKAHLREHNRRAKKESKAATLNVSLPILYPT